jgi:hypothetical protein
MPPFGWVRKNTDVPNTKPRAPEACWPEIADYMTFELAGLGDFQALDSLLEDGVPVSMLEDGSAIVGDDTESFNALGVIAQLYDIDVDVATDEEIDQLFEEETHGLDDLTVAYTGNQDDLLSLTELGFDDLKPVNATTITDTASVLDDVDVMWIGSSLTFTQAQAQGSRRSPPTWPAAGASSDAVRPPTAWPTRTGC